VSPQPMEMTTSAARTTSPVRGLGKLPTVAEPDLVHDGDDVFVEVLGGHGTRGADVHGALGEVLQEGGGHLGASRVLDADEEDFGNAAGSFALRMGEGVEPVAGESAGDDRQVRLDFRCAGEGRVGLGDVAFDHLGAEDTTSGCSHFVGDAVQDVLVCAGGGISCR
jgi:hypothetical protein